jgi:hypothetical protein
MKKIFSYSLFEPKVLPPHRDWDNWANDKQRYWFNIPTILLINKTLYPDYDTVFYVSPNIWNNPLSKIFEFFDNVRCETIQREYKITEPAIWRMMPLWERGVSVLHTRDIDSLTSEAEYRYIKIFENSEAFVGSIRSHENHLGPTCRMLAGLSSFKPNKISPAVKGMNFDLYYSQKLEAYGSDQELLIKIFTTNSDFTSKSFLDCKIDRQVNKQDFSCLEADLSSVNVEQDKKEILDKIKQFNDCSWLGQPCDSRGKLLNFLLENKNNIKDKFLLHKNIKKFYGVI